MGGHRQTNKNNQLNTEPRDYLPDRHEQKWAKKILGSAMANT